MRLTDGTVVGSAFDGHLWLRLPAAYLPSLGATEGNLLRFGLTPDGLRLDVVSDDALTEPADLGAALRATLDTHGEPIELDIAVPSVCANDPQVLRTPRAPFTELLPRLGFAVQDQWLAEEGFDFAARRVELQAGRIAELHRLEPHEGRAVGALVDGYRELADGRALGEPDSLCEVLGLLADPGVAAAVLAETIGGHSRDPAALRSLAETYEPRASHAARVGLRWLRAKAIERLGAVAEAETELHAAVTLDPNWPLALEDLARYESDRGDANRALALLHRGGVEAGDELLELLAPFESTPRTDIGRNEQCWCGSGRKYKKCHLNKAEFALPERAGWLYAKAARQIRDGHTTQMAELAELRGQHWESAYRMLDALQDPLLESAMLFEGGVLETFLEHRLHLLPEDERLLAQQWLLSTRSIFEVTHVVPGEGFTARDTRTGDRHEVTATPRAKPPRTRAAAMTCSGCSTRSPPLMTPA